MTGKYFEGGLLSYNLCKSPYCLVVGLPLSLSSNLQFLPFLPCDSLPSRWLPWKLSDGDWLLFTSCQLLASATTFSAFIVLAEDTCLLSSQLGPSPCIWILATVSGVPVQFLLSFFLTHVFKHFPFLDSFLQCSKRSSSNLSRDPTFLFR